MIINNNNKINKNKYLLNTFIINNIINLFILYCSCLNCIVPFVANKRCSIWIRSTQRRQHLRSMGGQSQLVSIKSVCVRVHFGCSYIAIVHPLKSRTWCSVSRTNKVIAAVWITSALLSSPLLYIMVALTRLDCFIAPSITRLSRFPPHKEIRTISRFTKSPKT